ALESWCFRLDLPEPTRVLSEVKPKNHGINGASGSVDLLVARWSDEEQRIIKEPPRVWIELKERGTWWVGGASKPLRQKDRSLYADLHKWKKASWLPGDVVVACQIISHEAEGVSTEPLPLEWRQVLDDIHSEFPRFLPPRSVGYPSITPLKKKTVTRFATI